MDTGPSPTNRPGSIHNRVRAMAWPLGAAVLLIVILSLGYVAMVRPTGREARDDIQMVRLDPGQLHVEGAARPNLGITYVPLNGYLASLHGLPRNGGVLVTDVRKDSPAAFAGILVGDVLRSFDGQVLGPDASLLDLLWKRQAGEEIVVEMWRDGGLLNVRVVLGSLPERRQ